MLENINALDEIHKGAQMGQDAISYVLNMVESDLKKELEKEFEQYDCIDKKIKSIYKKYNSDDKPHETNVMTRAMTFGGIEMKTINNKSQSKLAELLLQGNNMGIIEGRKILNNKHLKSEVKRIVSEFVNMQEKNVENLKKYL